MTKQEAAKVKRRAIEVIREALFNHLDEIETKTTLMAWDSQSRRWTLKATGVTDPRTPFKIARMLARLWNWRVVSNVLRSPAEMIIVWQVS